ncbi:hypothetical protein V1498_08450 [Peribacillus sp. SCS-26]|uniref:hypothetical protein n=1 Tax=Paraperibacillus marinus TaxID=3115295 RepID=UPI003906C2CD
MRIYNKQELLQRDPELAADVFEVWGSSLFVYLDLGIFAVVFSMMLFSIGEPLLVIICIPAIFFIVFLLAHRLLIMGRGNSD